MTKKIKKTNPWSRCKYGIWGTLGSGGNCEVNFIQTILTSEDIDNVKLISDIPESQKWKIQDLFQRNVNNKRVDEGIIPYLNNKDKIKFFNPLTLIVLPHEPSLKIKKTVSFLEESCFEDENGIEYNSLSNEDYYRFSKADGPEFYGKIEWNPNNCFMVAIDGQHRLSALKKIKKDPSNSFTDWKIPAVVLIVRKLEDTQTPDLLEIVRGVFVDINDKAEKLGKARKILLNDTLPVDVLCQEIIEYSHSSTNPGSLPLHFFDWRGDTDENQQPVSKIVSVEELNNWFISYFGFSADGTKFKLPNWLISLGLNQSELNYKSSEKLRKALRKEFVPAFHGFFSKLDFVGKYFKEIDKQFHKANLAYFLTREKYGQPDEFDLNREKSYEAEFKKRVKDEIRDICLPALIRTDVGLRSIVFCYSQYEVFKKIYLRLNKKSAEYDWIKHSEFLANIVNKIIESKWLADSPHKSPKPTIVRTSDQDKLLTNLVFSASESVLNYRLEDIEKGLGALMLRVCIQISKVDPSSDEVQDIISSVIDNIQDSYKKDLRKEVKANLIPTFNGSMNEFKEKIKVETERKLKAKMNLFDKYFNTK